MNPAAANPAEMLAEMSACAYRLGMVFGAEAERAGTVRVDYFQLFDRCFFAVRVAIALQLRLQREGRSARAEAREDLRERPERLEQEAADSRDRSDRLPEERDREHEPVSMAILLNTLQGVADDAAALPGPEPSALPTLRELLARMSGEGAPGPAPPVQVQPVQATFAAPAPPRNTPLRSRLTGSATTLTLPPCGPPPRPALGPVLRRATGPPPR